MSTNRFASSGSTRHPPFAEHEHPASSATGPEYDEEDARRGSILLGESLAIRRLRSQVQRIAPYFRTALIRGEIGAGKQLVARAIHTRSPAADGPFVVSSATSLAEAIAAETNSAHPPVAVSLLESAHGGTLFLDGIGELPFPLQAGLLRFLRACDSREAPGKRAMPWAVRSQPVPSQLMCSQPVRKDSTSPGTRPDTRIVAASHRDLRTLSAIGQFRQDLYARLSVIEIFVPPLRQRVEDIPLLAAWLLRRHAARTKETAKLFAHATLAQFESRLWPNNLRDLDRVVTQAAALAEGPTIEPRHLLALVEHAAPAPAPKVERLQEVIQQHVLEVLTRCGGNKLRAAELLGISRSTLYRMIETTSASI